MTIEAEEDTEVAAAPKPMSNVEKAIVQYRKLDAKLEEIMARQKEETTPIKTQMERIEAMLKQYLEAQSWDNIKTPSGLAVLVKTKKPQVEDWGAFNTWIVENNRPDMLQKRLMESTYNDYVEEGHDEPAGTSVTVNTRLSIRAVKQK